MEESEWEMIKSIAGKVWKNICKKVKKIGKDWKSRKKTEKRMEKEWKKR